MPTHETLERFIRRVEENAHAEACEEFYAPHASMRENQGELRIGRDLFAAHERKVFARAKHVTSQCVRPAFVHGDHVVIRWNFRFEWLDGTVTTMDELTYQRWDGEQIVEETFFYDPVQRVPKQSGARE